MVVVVVVVVVVPMGLITSMTASPHIRKFVSNPHLVSVVFMYFRKTEFTVIT